MKWDGIEKRFKISITLSEGPSKQNFTLEI